MWIPGTWTIQTPLLHCGYNSLHHKQNQINNPSVRMQPTKCCFVFGQSVQQFCSWTHIRPSSLSRFTRWNSVFLLETHPLKCRMSKSWAKNSLLPHSALWQLCGHWQPWAGLLRRMSLYCNNGGLQEPLNALWTSLLLSHGTAVASPA